MERIRIVLAEDHAMVREGTRQILDQQPDFEVVGETPDGLEAVSLIAKLHPNVAILDIRMEGLNAIEVTKRVKELGLDTRTLVLTAYDDDDFVVAALEAGAQGYLLKTARMAELVEAVRAVNARTTVLHPSIAAKMTQILTHRGQNRDAAPSHAILTSRELDVLRLAAQGMRNREIGEYLNVSSRTVEGHFTSILNKLGVSSRTSAVMYAASHNWLSGAVGDAPEGEN